MAQDTFKRYENKYLIDRLTMDRLIGGLQNRMALDTYNKNGQTYAISNLYYDTADSHLIRTSLQKPIYKEKLRLRAYGVPNLTDSVFLEIKKKYRGIVNKRRSALVLADAYALIASGQIPVLRPGYNNQVLKEIDYFLESHEIWPQLYLAYDRLAFFDREDPSVRVSFDTHIRTRRTDLRLEAGDWGEPLLSPEQWLMEVKVAGNLPFWLARLLSDCHVRPVSFSKYGTEYQQWLKKQSRYPDQVTVPSFSTGPLALRQISI